MRLIDADALSGQLNERLRCCNKGSVVEACLLAVLDIINSMPIVSPPSNGPLTLEELREMDGEPVWISYFAGGPNVCMLVDAKHDVCRDAHGGFAVFENLGRTWIAYRRKSKAPANAE